MHMALYQYPDKAKVDRYIAKEKIYQQNNIHPDVKRDLIDQIKSIRWLYKLSQQTINLTSTEALKEFEIIQIHLKGEVLNPDCLVALDKAIPNPIIFEVMTDYAIKVMAAHKTINSQGNGTIIQSDYFISESYDLNEKRLSLPNAISLEALYHAILKTLIPKKILGDNEQSNESIEVLIAKENELRSLEKQIVALDKKIMREKQFNRKVEMNAELKQLKAMQAALLAQ